MSADTVTGPCKVVILLGSPRKNGYTQALADTFLAPFIEQNADIRRFYAYDLPTRPCTDCRVCHTGAPCPFNEQDGFDAFLTALYDCDIVVLATPVFFSSLPGPLKLMVDRLQQSYVKRFILKEPLRDTRAKGILLVTSGDEKEELPDALFLTLKQFLDCAFATCEGYLLMESTDNGPREDVLMNARLLAKSLLMGET